MRGRGPRFVKMPKIKAKNWQVCQKIRAKNKAAGAGRARKKGSQSAPFFCVVQLAAGRSSRLRSTGPSMPGTVPASVYCHMAKPPDSAGAVV